MLVPILSKVEKVENLSTNLHVVVAEIHNSLHCIREAMGGNKSKCLNKAHHLGKGRTLLPQAPEAFGRHLVVDGPVPVVLAANDLENKDIKIILPLPNFFLLQQTSSYARTFAVGATRVKALDKATSKSVVM